MGTNTILGKRILMVDDEVEIRRTYHMLLSLYGYEVTEAMNGAEGLAMFAPDRFDLVITDREMPVMKGPEMAKRIKQIAPHQPILMITAYSETIGPENPVDAILGKPFGLDELRQTIKSLIAVPTVAE